MKLEKVKNRFEPFSFPLETEEELEMFLCVLDFAHEESGENSFISKAAERILQTIMEIEQ